MLPTPGSKGSATMETVLETVIVTTTDGTVEVFEICAHPFCYAGRRAYVPGRVLYYDERAFERELVTKKGATIERKQPSG